MEDRAILPLRHMDTDLARRNPGSPDAALVVPYHSDGDPNMEITTWPRVGLPLLGGEADGQVLHHGLRLSDQQTLY